MSDDKPTPELEEILATIRRIIAEDEHSASAPAAGRAGPANAAAAPPPPPPGAAGEPARRRGGTADDVLELTAAINEDGSVRHLAPIGSSATAAAAGEKPSEVAPAAAAPDAPAPEPERPQGEGPSLPPQPQAAAGDALVSEVTSLAAAAAFARVAAAPRGAQPQHEAPMLGGRPLDEVVCELLQPLLQAWLDDNLPRIVERLVEAEISRIGRHSGSP